MKFQPIVTLPLFGTNVLNEDCFHALARLPENSIDAIVTDPPYGIGFMGKEWDTFSPAEVEKQKLRDTRRCGENATYGGKSSSAPSAAMAAARYDLSCSANQRYQDWFTEWSLLALRALKPGGHALVFGGTRTFHRLACALEDAGFEIRDVLSWNYGCLSEDTEILVDGRWEHWRSATCGRLALCYDAAHETFSWQPIQETFQYAYDDTAYRIQSDRTDQIVSRNHRCLVERGGTYVFQVAEEAAREREACVPVLEDVSDLLQALPVPNEGASRPESVLRYDVSADDASSSEASVGTQGEVRHVLGVRKGGVEVPLSPEARPAADVLQQVQRGPSRCGMGGARAQRSSRVDSRVESIVPIEDGGIEQPCLEGRRDLLQEEGELQARQVRSVSDAVPDDGSEGRVRHGASSDRGDRGWTPPASEGSSSPCQSRPAGQQTVEPDAVRDEHGSQAVRASRFTTTSVARVTPLHYSGVVWCVRVPTGAFVARRNGKVFVTGNSGFPKSLDVSKAIDKDAGAVRGRSESTGSTRCEYLDRGEECPGHGDAGKSQSGATKHVAKTDPATLEAKKWEGWGTALKPAWEPVIVARKPLIGTVVENVLAHGTGAINIDGCRIGVSKDVPSSVSNAGNRVYGAASVRTADESGRDPNIGRWPANVLLDEEAAAVLDEQSGVQKSGTAYEPRGKRMERSIYGETGTLGRTLGHGDTGGASRFFYVAKASRRERDAGLSDLPDVKNDRFPTRFCTQCEKNVPEVGSCGCENPEIEFREAKRSKNIHPTVKPITLMEWLLKLIVPPGGIVLDTFAGSGTTGCAAEKLGIRALLVEREAEYIPIINGRLKYWRNQRG